MNRQNLFADGPWDSEEHGPETGLVHRAFWRPDNARMGATLWDLCPGAPGMRMHMHYGAEEMFFVLSGASRVPDDPRAKKSSLPATSSPVRKDGPACTPTATRTTSRRGCSGSVRAASPTSWPIRSISYAWVATRDPDLPAGSRSGRSSSASISGWSRPEPREAAQAASPWFPSTFTGRVQRAPHARREGWKHDNDLKE